jgi:hypothetical protein
MKNSIVVAAISGLILVSTAAKAGGLADAANVKKINEGIAEYAGPANTACGTAIKFTYDAASTKGTEPSDVINFVWAATEAFSDVCKNVDGSKAVIKTKIKTVIVKKGAAASYELKGSTFTYVTPFDIGSSTPRDGIIEWLKGNL